MTSTRATRSGARGPPSRRKNEPASGATRPSRPLPILTGIREEGCVACHDPHGSVNDKMLVARRQLVPPLPSCRCKAPDSISVASRARAHATSGSRLAEGNLLVGGLPRDVHGSNVKRPFGLTKKRFACPASHRSRASLAWLASGRWSCRDPCGRHPDAGRRLPRLRKLHQGSGQAPWISGNGAAFAQNTGRPQPRRRHRRLCTTPKISPTTPR